MAGVYIDRTFVSNHLGASVLSGCLVYGGNPASVTASLLDSVISGAADFVNSHVAEAAYETAQTQNYSQLQYITFAVVKSRLLERSNQVVPQATYDQIAMGVDFLKQLSVGKLELDGLQPSDEGAPAGGHTFGDNSATGEFARVFSAYRLRGTWG